MMSAQIVALIASIVHWKKYKDSTEKYFLFFLIYIVFNEILGFFIGENNLYIYNIFTTLSVSFYLFWFYQILKNKTLIKIFGIIFLVTLIFSIFKQDFWNSLWVFPFIPYSIIIIICATLFFIDLLKNKNALNYIDNRKFWIVTGLLVFYIGFLPISLTWELIDKGSLPFRIMMILLNIILYGFFTKGFLCSKQA